AIAGVEHSMKLARVLQRLQDTTAQIRVRAAFVLLIGFTALADTVGLETILGAFAAGALLSLIDRDEALSHPQFRGKLEAAGLRCVHPDLLRHHRSPVRPEGAVRECVDRGPRAPLPARDLPGAGPARARLRTVTRPLAVRNRGGAAVDLAAVRRSRDADRPYAWGGEPGERGRPGRCRGRG